MMIIAAVKLTLRAYNPADFETLYEIDAACYEPDIAYSRAELRHYLDLPDAECLVAETADERETRRYRSNARSKSRRKVIGFCITAREDAWGYIVTMDVLEAHRRYGVATALLRDAERSMAAHGVREAALETATDNETAIAFWQKHGYRTRGVRKDYYPGGRDAFSMTKKIATA
ncbi:MAG: GNAT family N-acetyltransferase [Candidatus Acidiferrales bacterium]